jgi:Flp pilus assembly protein TadD
MKSLPLKITLILLAVLWCGQSHANAQASPPPDASSLLTAEGQVSLSRAGTTLWLAAETNAVLQNGDRLRTGLRSRAVVRLGNLSVVRVNELTTFLVQPPTAPGKTAKLNVQSGSTYFFSREKPADVEFSTPLSSGAIRGTEFNLAVAEDGRSVVTLLDGALSISNALGALELVSGEAATVEAGQTPRRTTVVNALNVIQWCLYYPGVVDADELGLSAAVQQDLAASLAAYRSGDLLAAQANYPTARTPGSDAEKIYFAQLLLASGQVAQADAQLAGLNASAPLAGALREVVAAVKNQAWVRGAGSSLASEWLADSYYLQSRGKLNDALAAARRAVAQSPNFGFGWARVAELEFSFGRVPAANDALGQALNLAPRNAAAVSLKGFLLAANNQTAEARRQFDAAIALDGALGNAWLGRGLIRIHRGDAAGGRQDLQVAATVEPQRAVLRSYLGKAFANARDGRRAEKEFKLAQTLDPNDPTVWLYSALLNEQENKINDAVRDLEKSQALNDNRKIYRSQMLLDQDRAVRGANLANIYRDAGLEDVGVREAVKAVNSDYANYSAHLFLADSYYGLRDPNGVNLRYETPFQNEYLVANLLAPAGAGTLSPQVSQQEYSKLFERDHAGVSSDTKYLSRGDWYQRTVGYGNFGGTAFALEQDYSSTHGYRPNSDQEDKLYDFKLKQQLTPHDSVFAEVELRETTGGNLLQYYKQSDAANSPLRFTEKQEPIVLAGLHHEWTPGVDTLLLFSRLADSIAFTNPLQTDLFFGKEDAQGPIRQVLPFALNQDYRSKLEIYSLEAQHIWQAHQFTTIIGGRWQQGDFATRNVNQAADLNQLDLFPETQTQNVSARFNRGNVYAYEYWQPWDSLRLIGGLSYDRLVIPENFRYAPVSASSETAYHLLPKAGIIWTPQRDTTLRAGYSESVGGASIDQSFQLEPSQVAGFNQAFRSLIPEAYAGENAGARFTAYGVSLEQKLPTRTYLALGGELLKSKVGRQVGTYAFIGLDPVAAAKLREDLDFTEWSITGSAHQLVGRDWSFGAVYRVSHAKLRDSFPDIPSQVEVIAGNFSPRREFRGLLQTLDLSAVWQRPNGLFARLDTVWTHQDNGGDAAALAGDDFWQLNVQAGWRFFHRRAELAAGLLNVTAQNYHLNPLNLYSEAPRDRVLFVQLKFLF